MSPWNGTAEIPDQKYVTSHGYVSVRVPDHPKADKKGYRYEHRLVAEKHLGRLLRSNEIVHHINGDKQDNRWENLKVLNGKAEHHREHGHYNPETRGPDEPNPEIDCACGCGQTLKKYDEFGRPRQFISGHNMFGKDRPLRDSIIDQLQNGPLQRSEIAETLSTGDDAIGSALWQLKEDGEVANPKYGVWSLPGDAESVHDPRSDDTIIECGCGCGETLKKYDDWGRERRFLPGHNGRAGGTTESLVRDYLREHGRVKTADIVDDVDRSRYSITRTLTELKGRGEATNPEYGIWEVASEQ